MAQGRGNANRGSVLFLTVICLMAIAQPTLATMYSVGGVTGWTFNVVNWTLNKSFKAGDVLVFTYNKSLHDLVKVSATGYKTCTKPSGSRVYRTGKDYITLSRGMNYFICSIGTHCQSNMKIAVYAA